MIWEVGEAPRSGGSISLSQSITYSNAARAHKTQKWLNNGPIWVRRPPDKCTGGETGPKKRFPLVPGPAEAKKGSKLPKFNNFENVCPPPLGLLNIFPHQ